MPERRPPAAAERPGRRPAPAAFALFLSLFLAGCALTPPGPPPSPALAPAWAAPRPHGGDVAALSDWWRRFDDPLVADLVAAAQARNGAAAEALARIAQARAEARAAGAPLAPTVALGASAIRSRSETSQPTVDARTTSAGLDASWELDLFGAVRSGRDAARARAEGADASWHDLRVTLAAEVASTYVALRECEQLVDVLAADAVSRQRTSDLTGVKRDAGLAAPADHALAVASSADGAARLVAQQATCAAQVKNLVALTGLDEADLAARLAARRARLPEPAAFAVSAVPAQWLRQRPDLAAAERDVLAAAAEVGIAQADRYPRIALTGSIAPTRVSAGGVTLTGTNFSFGPSLSLPLFDAGRRAATAEAAQARYDQQAARYTQQVREAVREVETALVRLDAAARRDADAQRAAEGFATFLRAARVSQEAGTGSLLDLESARRNALAAEATRIGVQRERVDAWVALYKAMGGGWSADRLPDSPDVSMP